MDEWTDNFENQPSKIGDVLGLLPGPQPKAGTGHKMQSVPVVFERYIVRDTSLTYFWQCLLAH